MKMAKFLVLLYNKLFSLTEQVYSLRFSFRFYHCGQNVALAFLTRHTRSLLIGLGDIYHWFE